EATGTAPVTPFVARYANGGANLADDAGTANGANGSGAATAKALQLGGATTDVLERPIIPSLYLSDLGGGDATGPTGTLANSTAGDWQNNGAAFNPQFVAGTWKPYAGPNTSVGDTVANGTFLGPNADAYNTSLNSSIEKYGAEVRWDSSSLTGLLPGHWYRAQVIVH